MTDDLGPDNLKDLLRQMLRIRMVEERIAELYPEQEMRCPVHLCIGQEAVAAGVCAHLAGSDYAMSGHRSHGHYLAKGGDMNAMFAELYGKATGCSQGKGGSMHLIDQDIGFIGATPIVGSTIPIAVGAAFASAMRGEERVTAAFFGEGATEEGVFHESVNFAVLKNLPVVFVCENNLYSVYSPLSVRQPSSRGVCDLARGHGLESAQANGNDVGEVHELGMRAVEKARRGDGPMFIEFATYRWREHCGPFYDNDIGYRTEREFEEWKEKCPIERLQQQLLAEDIAQVEKIAELREELGAEIETAVNFAKQSPFPAETEIAEHIYAT